eukprot:ANDGO_07682.mRNA.1 hypothetical protein
MLDDMEARNFRPDILRRVALAVVMEGKEYALWEYTEMEAGRRGHNEWIEAFWDHVSKHTCSCIQATTNATATKGVTQQQQDGEEQISVHECRYSWKLVCGQRTEVRSWLFQVVTMMEKEQAIRVLATPSCVFGMVNLAMKPRTDVGLLSKSKHKKAKTAEQSELSPSPGSSSSADADADADADAAANVHSRQVLSRTSETAITEADFLATGSEYVLLNQSSSDSDSQLGAGQRKRKSRKRPIEHISTKTTEVVVNVEEKSAAAVSVAGDASLSTLTASDHELYACPEEMYPERFSISNLLRTSHPLLLSPFSYSYPYPSSFSGAGLPEVHASGSSAGHSPLPDDTVASCEDSTDSDHSAHTWLSVHTPEHAEASSKRAANITSLLVSARSFENLAEAS